MAWWKKLFGSGRDSTKPDYYQEGLDLLARESYHEALTSFRLALRESPGDTSVLQQIAVTYTKIGMTEEAAKTYRHVLQKKPDSPGAHYGLAFLLLRAGRDDEAENHLRAFLADPPDGPEASRHVAHARAALDELSDASTESAGEPASPDGG